jgi:hypothetical protein
MMRHRFGIRALGKLLAPRFLGLAAAGVLAAASAGNAAADGFTITQPIAGRALAACTGITMSGGTIDSAGLSVPSTPTNKGTVYTNGNITLSGSSIIDGDVILGPGKKVTTSGSAHVTGTTTVATANYNCTPIDMAAMKTAVQASNDNAKIPQTSQHKNPLSGANKTDFAMSGTDTLALPAGTYYFTSFSISGSSVITTSGPVRIFCSGSVSLSGGSVTGSNGYALRLWLSGASFALSSSTFKGFIYAPTASASLSSSTLVGSLFANSLSISGPSHVTRAIDDVKPQVSITSPADNSLAADPAHVLVKGTVTDETDVSLKVNDQPVTIAADGTWQITLNLSNVPSPVAVTATATDVAGNIATATIHVLTDHTPPVIQFWETGKQLVTGQTTQFGRDAHVEIRVTDDLSTFTYTAKLDAGTYKSLDPIAAEGTYTVSVHAVDAAGNFSDAQVLILIDKTPPVIALTESNTALDTKYKRNIAIDIKVTDALTAPTYTAKLDGVDYVSGAPITTEGRHVLLVTAKDNVGNPNTAQASFLIDKSAPTIAFYESNNKIDSTNARFKTDAKIEIRVADVVSTATYTATLDGAPYHSLDNVSADGHHKIIVNAVDEDGHARLPRRSQRAGGEVLRVRYRARSVEARLVHANGRDRDPDHGRHVDIHLDGEAEQRRLRFAHADRH